MKLWTALGYFPEIDSMQWWTDPVRMYIEIENWIQGKGISDNYRS